MLSNLQTTNLTLKRKCFDIQLLPLSKFIEVLLLVLLEDFKLCLKVLSSVVFESLQDVNEAVTHELVPKMNPKVQVIRTRDESVDESETSHAEGLIISDQ